MKNLVVQKKLEVWNEVVERANSEFEGNRKEFWAFVCRRTKGKRGITALRNSAGVSVTGKLEVLKRHYQQLGTVLIQLLMIVGRRKWIRKCVSFHSLCGKCIG